MAFAPFSIKSITQSMASNSHLSVTAFTSEMFFSVLCKCFMVYVCLIWFMFYWQVWLHMQFVLGLLVCVRLFSVLYLHACCIVVTCGEVSLVRLRPVWMTNHPPSVLWHCWLGHPTCKNCRPYNLYCVGADVKPCSINQHAVCWWCCSSVLSSVEVSLDTTNMPQFHPSIHPQFHCCTLFIFYRHNSRSGVSGDVC